MTNKIILSSLCSLFLFNTLSAKDILKEYDCGESFHGEKNGHLPCKTISVKQSIEIKIKKIKDFKTLFYTIGVDSFTKLYDIRRNRKLLNDIFINDYTHTYLLYKKVVNFKDVLEKSRKELNATKGNFINEKSLGGEFIALIHIQTNSNNAYKKIEKKLPKRLLTDKNLKLFHEKLLELEKQYNIKIKNYISSSLPPYPTNDLNSIFDNFIKFETLIKGEDSPIAFKLYHDKRENLSSTLDAYYFKNNLNYIKKHPNEFKTGSVIHYAKLYTKINQMLQHHTINWESNKTIKMPKQSLPKRYDASLTNKSIKTEPFSYHIKEESVKVRYPRIDSKIKFLFSLQIQEDIKRDAKVIIQTIKMSVKANNSIIAEEKNSQIKADTFVNFPKLLFSKIESNHIGNIEETFIFDRYEQEKDIKGIGLIQEATCGYKVKTKTNQLQFYCKDIKLKPLNIAFKHQDK